jgi:hypothetical protein
MKANVTRQPRLTDRPGHRSEPRPDWEDHAVRSARLTQLEDRLWELEARIEKGCAAWAEDEAAGLVSDYTKDKWEHKPLFERLIAERREVFGQILEVEPWRV